MTFGIQKYIEQVFGKGIEPQYSEILYEASVAGVATQFVQRNWGEQGAKMILVHSMFLQTPALAPPARQITDRFGRIVFQFTSIVDVSGYYDLPYILKGSELFFTLNEVTANFTIGYQYLMEPERP